MQFNSHIIYFILVYGNVLCTIIVFSCLQAVVNLNYLQYLLGILNEGTTHGLSLLSLSVHNYTKYVSYFLNVFCVLDIT